MTADVTEAMTRVVTEGTAYGNAQGLGRPAAGKTGTTTDNLAAWFDGFTPQLCAAVGIYQGDGTKTITLKSGTEVTGGTYPVKIWAAFMKGALPGQKVISFPPRVGVGDQALPVPTTAPTTTAPTTPHHRAPDHGPHAASDDGSPPRPVRLTAIPGTAAPLPAQPPPTAPPN